MIRNNPPQQNKNHEIATEAAAQPNADEADAMALDVLIDRQLIELETSQLKLAPKTAIAFASQLESTFKTIVEELGTTKPTLALRYLLRFIDTHSRVLGCDTIVQEPLNIKEKRMIDDLNVQILRLYGLAAKKAYDLAAKTPGTERGDLVQSLMKSVVAGDGTYGVEAAASIIPVLPKSALAALDELLEACDARIVVARQAIAEARGDLDQFLALEAQRSHTRQEPLRAAEKLLAAGRLDEAMSWVQRCPPYKTHFVLKYRMHLPDPRRGRLEANILEAQSDSLAAQTLRWVTFENTLHPGPLRDYLTNFEGIKNDETDRAFAHVLAGRDIDCALIFFIEWPRLDVAAELVVTNTGDWNHRNSLLLSVAAGELEANFPLAASILYRALLDPILKGESRYNVNAKKYIFKLHSLSKVISKWDGIDSHIHYHRKINEQYCHTRNFKLIMEQLEKSLTET